MQATANSRATAPVLRDHSAQTGTAGRAVLLLNLGTPDEPTTPAVRRYLTEFLSDPEVIRLPRGFGWFNWPLARLIAQFRSPKSAHAYSTIWTDRGSPLKFITEDQVAALESELPGGWRVFYAMRYGNPTVQSAIRAIADSGIDDVVVIPMYPQFSGPTTGTAIADLYDALQVHGQHFNIQVRNTWYDDIGYVEAQAEILRQRAEAARLTPANCRIVYSAHSMPKSYVEAGDPYQQQVLRTVDLVTRRLGWDEDRVTVSYQSKLGPVPWLDPSTEQTLLDLADAGEPNVLVCPISFTADCLESLEEIGIGYREQFESKGGRMHLCPALNTEPAFIKALMHLTLKGSRAMTDRHLEAEPLLDLRAMETAEDEEGPGSLVMIGVALESRVQSEYGPHFDSIDTEAFQAVKKPHAEVTTLLQKVAAEGGFHECFVWNTCRRFEFYGWMKQDPDSAAGHALLDRTRRAVLGAGSDRLAVNVLQGDEVEQHLVRTMSGLNSGLPGDSEVGLQLDVAYRIAAHCGTAGPRIDAMRERIADAQAAVRSETDWGAFQQEYCPVALRRIAMTHGLDWSGAKCVILGGSSTARSVLLALRAHFEVAPKQITVVHRSQSRGRQIKRIVRALAGGTRLRVDSYHDDRVLQAVADADLVVCAVDSREPVLRRADLEAAASERSFAGRPLAIVDFNTFASTEGFAGMDGVEVVDQTEIEREVALFADGLCRCPAFQAVMHKADAFIHCRYGLGATDDATVDAADESPWKQCEFGELSPQIGEDCVACRRLALAIEGALSKEGAMS